MTIKREATDFKKCVGIDFLGSNPTYVVVETSRVGLQKKSYAWGLQKSKRMFPPITTVELGDKELFGHPKIVPKLQMFLILMK